MTCYAPDCDRDDRAAGLCRMHYLRMWRHGTLEIEVRPTAPVVDGAIARVPLTRGLVAIIDATDVEVIARSAWQSAGDNERGYYAIAAGQRHGLRGSVLMHRLLLGVSRDLDVDHINGDGLDNRRCNLRLCTAEQNARNLTRLRSNNTSGYIGVGYRTDRDRWRAYVKTDRMHQLGVFDTAEEAARARDEWIRANCPSDFWTFNFPRPGERGINRERKTA